jgi:hypothetical protein
MPKPWSCLAALFFVGFSLLSGCAGPTQRPVEEDRLSKLAVFYGRFIGQNKGNGPADEKELKEFIGKIDSKVNVDELFISPRDKQPYVVFYQIAAATPGAASVTAHEKVGANGKKMVGLSTGEVRSVDDAELQKLLGK